MSNQGDIQDMSGIDKMTNTQESVGAEDPSTIDIPFDYENYHRHLAKQAAITTFNEFLYNTEVQGFLAAEVKERDADWLRKILKPPFHPPLNKTWPNKKINEYASEPTEDEAGTRGQTEITFTRMPPPHMINMTHLANTFVMQSHFEWDIASEVTKHHLVNGITTGPRELSEDLVENGFSSEIQAVARVPPEIWKNVLVQLSLGGIRKVRLVCRTLLAVIDNDCNIFIEARHRMYGKGLFDPPCGLSELQYSVLLDHARCQRCGQYQTRRTLWGYMRKWCARCFELQTRSAGAFLKCEQLVEEFGSKNIRNILDILPFEGRDSYGGRAFLGFMEAEKTLDASGKTAEKTYRVSDFSRMVRLIDKMEAVVQHNNDIQDDDPNRVIWAQLGDLVNQFTEYFFEIQKDEVEARMFWALRTENIVVGTEQGELWARARKRKHNVREITALARANAVNEAIASASYGKAEGEENEVARKRVKPDALRN